MNRRKLIKTILAVLLVLALAAALLAANWQRVESEPVYYPMGLEGG